MSTQQDPLSTYLPTVLMMLTIFISAIFTLFATRYFKRQDSSESGLKSEMKDLKGDIHAFRTEIKDYSLSQNKLWVKIEEYHWRIKALESRLGLNGNDNHERRAVM